MTRPTYTQLEETCSLLFASYVRTISAIQEEWGPDLSVDTQAVRALSGLLSTLKDDAEIHKHTKVDDLVNALTSLNLIGLNDDKAHCTRHRDYHVGDDPW